MDILTLYKPSATNEENGDKVIYKNVTNFKDNGNGTITFKTQKYGEITTCLPWRLAKGVAEDAEGLHEAPPAPRAGNRARW